MGTAAPAQPTSPIVPLPAPLPVSEFGNPVLRDSVSRALTKLEADAPGHGNAWIDVNNKGAGVMVAHRFASGWAVVAAGRYSFEDKGVAATVGASW